LGQFFHELGIAHILALQFGFQEALNPVLPILIVGHGISYDVNIIICDTNAIDNSA